MPFIFESYFFIIWVAAFFTAIVSATVGVLGGTILIAVMAQFLKMEVLIPLHGIIQLSANASRTWFLREHIQRMISREMMAGIVVGSVLGAFYLEPFDDKYYNIVIGSFILFITFVPKFKVPLQFQGKWALLGFVASSVGLYVGAVGVLVGSVLHSEKLEKKAMVATQAAAQSFLHLAKVLVFVSLGFVIQKWLLLLVGTLVLTFVGSWVGTKILNRIPEALFRKILTVLIVILALRLIGQGLVEGFVR